MAPRRRPSPNNPYAVKERAGEIKLGLLQGGDSPGLHCKAKGKCTCPCMQGDHRRGLSGQRGMIKPPVPTTGIGYGEGDTEQGSQVVSRSRDTQGHVRT